MCYIKYGYLEVSAGTSNAQWFGCPSLERWLSVTAWDYLAMYDTAIRFFLGENQFTEATTRTRSWGNQVSFAREQVMSFRAPWASVRASWQLQTTEFDQKLDKLRAARCLSLLNAVWNFKTVILKISAAIFTLKPLFVLIQRLCTTLEHLYYYIRWTLDDSPCP